MLSPQLLIDLGKSLQLPHALPAVKQLQQQQCQWEEKKISERNLIEEKFKNQIEVARQRQLPTLNVTLYYQFYCIS